MVFLILMPMDVGFPFHVGRLLKLKQREDALARDIELVEWTFDPLELRNAYFNIEKLGAVVRRYVLNQYGTTSSHLHGGLPTDRCIAEWWIREPRVQDIIDRKPIDRSNVTERIAVPARPTAMNPRSHHDYILRAFRAGL